MTLQEKNFIMTMVRKGAVMPGYPRVELKNLNYIELATDYVTKIIEITGGERDGFSF